MGMFLWFSGILLGIFGILAILFGMVRWFRPSRAEALRSIAQTFDWEFRALEETGEQPDYLAIRGMEEIELAHSIQGTHESIPFHVVEHRYRLTNQDRTTGATTACFPMAEQQLPFHILPSSQARSLPEDTLKSLGKHEVSFNYYDQLSDNYVLCSDDATRLRNQIGEEGLDFLDDPENDEWRLDSNGTWLNLWLIDGNWISNPEPFHNTLEQFITIARKFFPLRKQP